MDAVGLYNYSARVRRKFATKLAGLPWQLVEKNREASYYSMKNILLHIVDNEDWIVNWVIRGKPSDYKRRRWEEYTDMRKVLDHLEEVELRTRRYLDALNAAELSRHVDFVLQSGERFDMTVEESLFQTFTEQLYHMGELIALLWQENVEPPKMQLFYNR